MWRMKDRQHSSPESPGHHQGAWEGKDMQQQGESSVHAVSHLGLPPLLSLWFSGCVPVCRFTSLLFSPGELCGKPLLLLFGSGILMMRIFVPSENQQTKITAPWCAASIVLLDCSISFCSSLLSILRGFIV